MCVEDGAQRDVYKLREDPEKVDGRKKREKEKEERRNRRKQERRK